MFEFLNENKKNKFYKIKNCEIIEAEQNMGILLPKQLKDFYSELGYGFLASKKHNINRIMDPESVEEFRLRAGQFAHMDESAIFDDYSKDKLFFFEVNESLYLSIGLTKKNNGKIFYYNKKIANNLIEFFKNYMEDEKYFM